MAGLTVQYSDYYSELEVEAKSRYEQKVRILGGVDPYCRLEAASVVLTQWNGMNGLKLRMLIFITLLSRVIVPMNN